MRKFLLFYALLLNCSMGITQWNPDPTENNLIVSVADKGTSVVANPAAASDGAGGMYIAWIDSRNSETSGNDI
ncbi:MAG TPA: hypothetical protein VK907_14340, partial [Phnomibacter sp.]|nr:hypothetical protein [Phnomibacter sp.]